MSNTTVFYADRPSLAYLLFLAVVALVSGLGVGVFAFLLAWSVWNGNWKDAALLLLCTLIAFAMALTWHPLSLALRQRRRPELHAITIDKNYLTYRDASLSWQIPLEKIADIKILSIAGNQDIADSWMTVVVYHQPDGELAKLQIDTLAFSNIWKSSDKDFARILWETVQKYRSL